jgi:hypothetical protein
VKRSDKMKTIASMIFSVLILAPSISAQTTAFTYQGKLTDGGPAASGTYQMQFSLHSAPSGAGNQVGTTITDNSVSVANGVFTVVLDFTATPFDGSARWLEIAVRKSTDPPGYTALGPRQPITSAPYAVKSLNADTATNSLQLGGQPANQYVLTGDPRLLDARAPLAGSQHYIQNNTGAPQTPGNFNITGNGTAGGTLSGNFVNAQTHYTINGSQVLTAAFQNLSVGFLAGPVNAGLNTAFFGFNAGHSNSGSNNSFFGGLAGTRNTDGISNSFFGTQAGEFNSTQSNNTFVGTGAGGQNGFNDVGNTAHFNTFIGRGAGITNTRGNNNTALGLLANVGAVDLVNSTVIGSRALVTQNNSLVLGSINGTNGATADTNVGIGTTAPLGRLQVVTSNDAVPTNVVAWDSRHLVIGGSANTGGIGFSYDQINNVGYIGALSPNAAWRNLVLQSGGGTVGIGTGTTAPEKQLHVNGSGILSTGATAGVTFRDRGSISPNDDWLWYSTGNLARFRRANEPGVDLFTISTTGVVQLFGLGTAGGVPLCFNPFNQISLCSSSIRYKQNLKPFNTGLDLIKRLRPVTFNWKADNKEDMGLVAEEVADVEPLLVTHNDKGEIEGVKYDRIGVVLISVVKGQQAQIEGQRKMIEVQQEQIEALKKLVCAANTEAPVCRAKP